MDVDNQNITFAQLPIHLAMKKIFALLLIIVAGVNIALADTPPPNFNNNGGNIGFPIKPKEPRPKDCTGDLQEVEGAYCNGILSVIFNMPEGRATMTVTRMEDGVSQTAVFYTFSTFSYNIGTAPGSYVINVRTSQCEYEGFLTIE